MKFPWSHTSIVEVLNNEKKVLEHRKQVLKDLTHKKIDISEFVGELGPALTSKETDVRLKGTKFLTDVLKDLPVDLLTDSQLEFIVSFYCDRMKDHHSIGPQVIIGILAIIKMKNLPTNSSTKFLNEIFKTIPCQSQVREDRANIFMIIKILSEEHKEELIAMQSDLVYGVINALGGERDPRNLVFLFEFMPTFIKTFPLRHLVEEMFESFACYFPIDFYPNPNDPEAITRDVLAEKLSFCLCAALEFADSCISLALEKLDSGLNVAKLDSLDLLIKSSSTFDNISLINHFDEIWQAIKLELMALPGNGDVKEKSLNLISAILSELTSDDQNLDIILNKIFTSIIGTLLNRESNLYKPTFQVVVKCAATNDKTCLYVAHKMLPIAITDLTSNDDIKNEEKVQVIADLNISLILLKQKSLLKEMQNDNYLLHIQKELTKILLQPDDPKLLNITLTALSIISSVITDENRQILYKKLSANLTIDNPAIVDCLLAFGEDYPNEVLALILNEHFDTDHQFSESTQNILGNLSKLMALPYFGEHVAKFLYRNLLKFHDEKLQLVVLNNFKDMLGRNGSLAGFLFDKFQFVDKLVELIRDEKLKNADILYQCSILLNLIMLSLSQDQQIIVIEKYLPQMQLNSSIKDLYITSGIVGYLDERIELENHFEYLVDELTKLSLSTKDVEVQRIANNLLCSLFNKAPNNDKHRKILKKVFEFLKSEVKNHNHQAVMALAWLSKGLLAKGHPDAAELLEDISDLLDHPTLSHAAALAFEVISLEYPQLHLPVVKHLFKQKLFILTMKFFESKIEKFSEHHLTALAHILQITPHAVLKMNLEKVGPILFKCITLNPKNEHTKAIVICCGIINHFILEKSKYIEDHLQHLVPQLLALTKYEGSMDVRIKSLECLKNLVHLPLFILTPYVQDVVHEVADALNDRKRLVRAEAVACRMAWYLLGDE